jgi:hypothetical protein
VKNAMAAMTRTIFEKVPGLSGEADVHRAGQQGTGDISMIRNSRY